MKSIGIFEFAAFAANADEGPPVARVEHPDYGHVLLRSRHNQPRRPAAQKRDEVAPLHCLMLPVLSKERIAHLATHKAAALWRSNPAYVAEGSFTTDASSTRADQCLLLLQ